jgi:hypothetical protein
MKERKAELSLLEAKSSSLRKQITEMEGLYARFARHAPTSAIPSTGATNVAGSRPGSSLGHVRSSSQAWATAAAATYGATTPLSSMDVGNNSNSNNNINNDNVPMLPVVPANSTLRQSSMVAAIGQRSPVPPSALSGRSHSRSSSHAPYVPLSATTTPGSTTNGPATGSFAANNNQSANGSQSARYARPHSLLATPPRNNARRPLPSHTHSHIHNHMTGSAAFTSLAATLTPSVSGNSPPSTSTSIASSPSSSSSVTTSVGAMTSTSVSNGMLRPDMAPYISQHGQSRSPRTKYRESSSASLSSSHAALSFSTSNTRERHIAMSEYKENERYDIRPSLPSTSTPPISSSSSSTNTASPSTHVPYMVYPVASAAAAPPTIAGGRGGRSKSSRANRTNATNGYHEEKERPYTSTTTGSERRGSVTSMYSNTGSVRSNGNDHDTATLGGVIRVGSTTTHLGDEEFVISPATKKIASAASTTPAMTPTR